RSIRASSGGLRYVKPMAVMLESRGLAQVSINMTNFHGTPLHRVFEMAKSEAARHGVAITSSEIVGLAPEDALLQVAEFFLRLEGFDASRTVLERRLEQEPSSPPPPGAARGDEGG